MEKKSCFHCGIKDSGLWRKGPSEKPVLCNACGTRWRLKGTLADYIPKHGITHMEIPAESEVRDLPLGFKIPRRKRSMLPQYCLTSTGRLHRQLLQILDEHQSAEKSSAAREEGNDPLICNTSWMATSSETALGAMLLK